MRSILGLAGLVLLAGWGCGPPEIMPVAPPGLAYQTVTPEKEEPAAEALGENRNTTALLPEAGTTVTPVPRAEPTEVGKSATTADGLSYETTKVGTGKVAEAGNRVFVHYTGKLENGKVFDTSRKGNQPFEFVIGAGGVIKGWDLGVAGMRAGEERRLTIPPGLAYGADSPSPNIPANSTLIFDLELVAVE